MPQGQTPGFHRSGPVTHPKTPNNKMNDGDRQRKEVYYMVQEAMGKGKVAFQPVFPEQTFALGLNRNKNLQQGMHNF
jgi:hypothetical protein